MARCSVPRRNVVCPCALNNSSTHLLPTCKYIHACVAHQSKASRNARNGRGWAHGVGDMSTCPVLHMQVHCLAGAPAPLSASLGLGPVQQKPVDDVTPALMDAAADAEAELPGAADANGVGGRKEGAGASMSSAGVDNRQQLNQAQLQGALPAPASAVIAGRPPHGDGQHSLMGSAERDKQAAGGLHAREVQSGVSTAVQAEVQQTEIDMPASKRAKTAD